MRRIISYSGGLGSFAAANFPRGKGTLVSLASGYTQRKTYKNKRSGRLAHAH